MQVSLGTWQDQEEGWRPHQVGFHGVPGTQSSIPSKRGKRVPEEAQAAGGWSARRKPRTATRSRAPRGREDAGGCGQTPPPPPPP
uniref:Uncharacterized protein n=1 Tax=Myotis myotis TaxID=51298 RepID=A0A7J8AMU7_MYOMY|nr:hypothetical protein mMyoMyo1_008153 [Myotis myotis]